ncbi:MAG: prepilin-type N-terminal cleavage/methylation domain-containing protein [Oxalobacteraceae bacterium]|nr:prepilin-type N-terminal cleavage/methylation domain-containing protein [Oxalobacteraceae bacterium]
MALDISRLNKVVVIRMHFKKNRQRNGFTLLEVLVALVIVM